MAAIVPKEGHCTVRMYCHGLGDCFLIVNRIGPKKDDLFKIMVDCGVILGTPEPAVKMKAVMEDVYDATGGTVDLLIVTHEHWDHVSGFAQETFDKLKVKELWYAWTEDPKDEIGRSLQETRSKATFALDRAIHKLAADSPLRLQLDEFLSAFGVGAKDSVKTRAAMARPMVRAKKTDYRIPGEVKELPGMRVYVLGPPKDVRIFKNDPSKKTPEVYGLVSRQGLAEAVSQLRPDTDDELSRPFDRKYWRPERDRKKLYASYVDSDNSWRTIDDNWTAAIGQLALQLDSDTNNTSLALAFEFPKSGKVMVFPGDAQVGNWLSWQDCTWHVKEGTEVRKVGAQQLLANTVLYKVGHHGSHNATLRDKGLEMMTHPGLCAMVPVDVDIAHNTKHWMAMPLEPLVARLREKTAGRTVLADQAAAATAPFTPGPVHPAVNRPLYVDLDLDTEP